MQHIFFAVRDQNIAVFVDMADITGHEIATAFDFTKNFLVILGTVPISLHDLGTADGELTILTLGQRYQIGIQVDGLDVRTRYGEPNCADFALCLISGI